MRRTSGRRDRFGEGDPTLFWRELLSTYLGDLLVGVAFLPAGLLYGLAVLYGWNHWLVSAFLILLTVPLARRAWQLRYQPQRSPSGQAYGVAINFAVLGVRAVRATNNARLRIASTSDAAPMGIERYAVRGVAGASGPTEWLPAPR